MSKIKKILADHIGLDVNEMTPGRYVHAHRLIEQLEAHVKERVAQARRWTLLVQYTKLANERKIIESCIQGASAGKDQFAQGFYDGQHQMLSKQMGDLIRIIRSENGFIDPVEMSKAIDGRLTEELSVELFNLFNEPVADQVAGKTGGQFIVDDPLGAEEPKLRVRLTE